MKITASQYKNVIDRSKIITQSEIERRKREDEELHREDIENARKRKNLMKELEKEAQLHIPSLEEELQAITTSNPLIAKVYEAEDMESDEMKTLKMKLNRMKYEKVLKRQVKDREEIKVEEKERDNEWEEIMEAQRLDEIQKYRQFMEERKERNRKEVKINRNKNRS